MPSGSRRLSVECGLGGEFAERVKKAVGGVWFVARKCRAGQEGRRWSVVCGEKTPSGSKDMSAECGLEREITAQVKGQKGPRPITPRPDNRKHPPPLYTTPPPHVGPPVWAGRFLSNHQSYNDFPCAIRP